MRTLRTVASSVNLKCHECSWAEEKPRGVTRDEKERAAANHSRSTGHRVEVTVIEVITFLGR